MHQISIEEGGKEPSPAHLKDLIDVCQAENVGVIFVQPEFDKRNAETIAQQTGTKSGPYQPLSYDWEEEMLNVAKSPCAASCHQNKRIKERTNQALSNDETNNRNKRIFPPDMTVALFSTMFNLSIYERIF